nr:hypothetical protein [Pseudomonas fluorescens]
MLPSHLLRMVSLCVSGDYQDPAVRTRIKEKCIPFLSKYRREVLVGSYNGRHARHAGFISKIIANTQLIRRTLSHAHGRLTSLEATSNVLSFQAAAQRRAGQAPAAIA